MKNRPERIQSFLVIMISFFLVVYPVYFQYNNLIEIDFFSPNPTFENLDQENLLADEQNKIKIFVRSFSPVTSLFCFFCIGQLLRLSFQSFSLDQPISVLRCWEVPLLILFLINLFFNTYYWPIEGGDSYVWYWFARAYGHLIDCFFYLWCKAPAGVGE